MKLENMLKGLYSCDVFDQSLTEEKARKIVYIKRFLECMVGDRKFRKAFHQDTVNRESLLHSRGIFDVDHTQLALLVPESCDEHSSNQLSEPDIDFNQYPELKLWKQWRDATGAFRQQWLERADQSTDDRYAVWRRRQSKRLRSEQGRLPSEAIVHALVAFELNKGCSMNCPFCGVAADSLQGVFQYVAENAQLFKEIAQVFVRRFGSAAGTAFCYWATDPSDNPDYLKFVKDLGDITGEYPQTTTAAPLRNLAWTQEMMEFRKTHISNVDRFSILSSGILKRVHETFTAEELALVELVCIGNHSLQLRTRTGRNLESKESTVGSDAHGGTIACVSGYLINMVERTIKLISPCPASKDRPLGYRIYAEASFSDAKDVDCFIETSIEQHMPKKVQMDQQLAFRNDLQYIPVENGFHLKSAHFLHKVEGESYMSAIGKYIHSGGGTLREVFPMLMNEYDINVFSLSGCIKGIFDRGLLSDEFDDTTITI